MSKKLIYKNEAIATITDEEAQQIRDAKDKRQSHINFKGESLKTLQIEIRKQEITNKTIYQMNKEELKEVIGDFERQYKEHRTGAIIHDDILGDEHEGIIKWALATDVITRKKSGELSYCFIVEPDGIEWIRKREAMRELWAKRKFAEEQSQIN